VELLDVVNEEDKVVDQAPRKQCHEEKLLHRGASIVVYRTPEKDKVLLQKRSEDKMNNPGELCFTGGHVTSGDSYREGAEKEFFEELYSEENGEIELEAVAKFRKTADDDHEFMKIFETVDSGPFNHGDEVAELKFMETGELKRMAMESPEKFTGTTLRIIEELENSQDSSL
jgi:isopentenyldiphosphate isomerase